MGADVGPLIDSALLADRVGGAAEFADHLLIELDDLVECVGNFAVDPRAFEGNAGREISLAKSSQNLEDFAFVQRFGGRSEASCAHADGPSDSGIRYFLDYVR